MPSKDREVRIHVQRAYYLRTKANNPELIKQRAANYRAKHPERLECPCSKSTISVHSKCAHLKTMRHKAYVEEHGEVTLKKVDNVNEPNAVQSVEPNVPGEVVVDPEQPRDARGDSEGPQRPVPRVDGSRPGSEAQGL